jgi:hypothetical protein
MSKNYCLTGVAASLEIGKGLACLVGNSATELAVRNNGKTANANLVVAEPTLAVHATTKSYVDQAVQGLSWKQYVRVCTTVALPANTAPDSNTLEATGNGSLNDTGIDGVTTLVVGDDVLVRNEGIAVGGGGTFDVKNGIYRIVQLGDAVTPWRLERREGTRAVSATEDVATNNAVFCSEGTSGADTSFVQVADSAVYGITALKWTIFSNVAFTAGDGISISGGVIAVSVHPAGGLDFNTDTTPGRLQIAADGVTTERIVDGAVTTAKLDDGAVNDIKRAALTGIVVRHNVFQFTDTSVDLLDGAGSAPLETNKSYLTLKTMVCVETPWQNLSGGDPGATVSVNKIDPTTAAATVLQAANESNLNAVDNYVCDICDVMDADASGGWVYRLLIASGTAVQGKARAVALAVKLD